MEMNDYISRADARSLVVKIDRKYMFGMSGKAFQDLYKGIDELPSVIPQEPKTGHWITKDDKEQGYDIGGVKTWYIQIMCSECGFIKTAIEGHTGQYHYCPNCGCHMVEPQENEDEDGNDD